MTYTHGHHESVLRSHTWRTAENSSRLPPPRPAARSAPARRGLRPGDDHGRPRPPGGAGRGRRDRRGGRRGGPGRRSTPTGLGVENLRFEVGDLFALEFPDASFDVDPPAPGAPAPRRPRGGAGGAAPRAGPRRRAGRPRLGLRGLHLGPVGPGPGPLARALLRRDRAQRPRRPHRAPAARPCARGGLLRRRRSRARRGPTPTPSPGPGGAACGPTGCATRASPSRRSSTA